MLISRKFIKKVADRLGVIGGWGAEACLEKRGWNYDGSGIGYPQDFTTIDLPAVRLVVCSGGG